MKISMCSIYALLFIKQHMKKTVPDIGAYHPRYLYMLGLVRLEFQSERYAKCNLLGLLLSVPPFLINCPVDKQTTKPQHTTRSIDPNRTDAMMSR